MIHSLVLLGGLIGAASGFVPHCTEQRCNNKLKFFFLAATNNESSKKTETERLPLGEIFQGRKYCFSTTRNIRSYEWDAKETEELWDDLADMAFRDNKEDYELQQIVLVGTEWETDRLGIGARYDVHDGQQRLVTLSLVLAALRDSLCSDPDQQATVKDLAEMLNPLQNRREPILRIELRHKEGTMLRRILKAQLDLPNPKDRKVLTNADQRVLGNYELLRKHADSLTSGEKLKLFDYLQFRVYLLVCIPGDTRIARNIVMGQGKGKNHEPIDDFKGQICFREVFDERDQEAVFEKWDELTSPENVGRDTVADACLLLASASLRRRVKKNDEVNVMDEWLKEELKLQGQGYDGRSFFHDQVLPGSKTLKRFREGTSPLGSPHGKADDPKLHRALLMRMMFLRRIAVSQLPCKKEVEMVILHYLMMGLPIEELNWHLKNFELIVLWMILVKPSPVVRHRRCFEFMDGKLTEFITHDEAAEVRRSLHLFDFGSKAPGRKVAVALLERLNAYQLCESSQVPMPVCLDLQLEHVLPQKPEGEYWKKHWQNKSAQSMWTHRLGNLALLNRKANAKASNKSFSSKKDYYINSPYPLTSILRDVDVWNEKALRSQHCRLLHLADKIWGF